MSSHALIKSALSAHAGLAALVGTRIRADLGDPDDDYPFVVFKRSGLQRITGLDGSVHGQIETFEIECWADNRSQSVNVFEQALQALDAAGLVAEEGDADGIDPELLQRVTVARVDV